jgi:hypothetical protein
MPAGSGQENPTMTATNPTATTKPAAPQKPAIDPETVTLSGYVLDERYAPGSVQTTDPTDPSKAHARIGEAAATYAHVPKHRHGLPESIARTPAEVPRGMPVVVDAEAWAPWAPLMAEVVPPGFPQRYAYSFVRVPGDHVAFDAVAEGDLDGDGVLSRATLHGSVDATGSMQLTPDVEFIDALE